MPSTPHRVLLAEPRGVRAEAHRAIETVERALQDTLILVGHVDHEEIEGTYGRVPERTVVVGSVEEAGRLGLAPGTTAAYLTGSTLSVDDTAEILAVLHERFPGLTGPAGAEIRHAGQNAVKAIAGRSDLVLVLVADSADSTDSLRLVEVARAAGTEARLLPDPDLLDPGWLEGVRTVGLTAGESVPEVLVEGVLHRLAELGFRDVETQVTATENVVFELPSEPAESGESGAVVEAVGERGGVDEETCAKLLERVDRRIEELLSAEVARWSAVDARVAVPVAAVAELLAAGGKRLRPLFCVTGYLAAGAAGDEDTVVDAAAALELLQAFALIHDDIMDNSPTRRGAPTVHAAHADLHARRAWAGESRRYGEGVALLAGDLALSYANRLAGRLTGPAAQVWHELVSEMIIGQHLDIALAAEVKPDPELSRWVAVCKSGRYTIHRPLALGAAIAGRPGLHAVFEAYGVAAGEAFQLRDDLLDAFGDAALTGKPTGLDLSEHKMTLLIALAAAKDPRVARTVEDSRHADWNPAELRAALLASGVRADVEQRIDALVADSRAALADAGLPRRWRLRLEELADMVAYRDR